MHDVGILIDPGNRISNWIVNISLWNFWFSVCRRRRISDRVYCHLCNFSIWFSK